jgi:sugar transferase (PEP-CTERM system associated)
MANGDKSLTEDLPAGIPSQSGFRHMCDLAAVRNVKSIIVALDQKRGEFPQKELLDCKMRGIHIIDGQSFYERITGKLLVERTNPSWLIFSDGFVKSGIQKIGKRLIDFATGVILLLFFSPIWVLVAVAIKLDSPGPVIFRQQRVGEFGKVYTLFKFRSMVCDAEEGCGPVWATENDPRITRVGKVIRKSRLDEFPQILNVLKGEMSFVGPRPERPYFVQQLKKVVPYYGMRFSVKPGITGWAQVRYSYGASEEEALEKLKYDLYYIKNMSLMMDLIVIFHTFKIVLSGSGAR